MDLRALTLYDHHCHSLLRPTSPRGDSDPTCAAAVSRFRDCFTESSYPGIIPHVPSTLFYSRGLRELAAVLECDPDERSLLTARHLLGPEALAQKLIGAAGIEMLLVDTGLRADQNLSVEELRLLLPCSVGPILRIETLAETLLRETHSRAELEDALRDRVSRARSDGYRSLKSIAAYRGGLDIDMDPDPGDVAAAWVRARAAATDQGWRLTERPLLDHLLISALEIAAREELPLQVHVGFGDDDADLRTANLLHLRRLLREDRFRPVPVVLLHCWPFVREAGYLAGIYPNVHVDLSLTFPFCAHGGEAAVLEMMEQAPGSKLMMATDASNIPDLYYLGALFLREGVGNALDSLVRRRWLTASGAEAQASALFRENAVKLYGAS